MTTLLELAKKLHNTLALYNGAGHALGWKTEKVDKLLDESKRVIELSEQPAQQEPAHEFAYKAITKHGHHCHFGTHEAARSWAGEGGEVETIKLRHFELVKTTDTSPQPAQPLADEQIDSIVAMSCKKDSSHLDAARVARAIEAAHGIKGDA